MNAPKQQQSCPMKAVLFATWQNAAENYSEAVAELLRQMGVLPRSEYQKLSQAAENARKRSHDAQAALEAHTKNPGCDDETAA
jgi:hypothetical protein